MNAHDADRGHDGRYDDRSRSARHFDAEIAAAIDKACRRLGGYRPAARKVDISPGYLHMLAHAKRRPSIVVAEILIERLGLDDHTARWLRELAVRDAGRATPRHH